jgi:CHASE3 domain sensor protein
LAWLQQSSMLLLLAVVLTLGASVLFFWVRSKLRK